MPTTAPQLLTSSLMRIGALTAACQYPPGASRESFRSDPVGTSRVALTEWINGAASVKLDGIQVSAAIQEVDSYVPPEQMLDPVASHLPIRTLRDGSGTDLSDEDALKINAACADKGIQIPDLGIFENLLHPDPVIRNQIHQHMLRGARAAAKLKPSGCTGVATFIGGDMSKSHDQNVYFFEEQVIPILRIYDQLGLKFRVENCPMPGWSGADRFVQNIACTPAMFITLARIARKHGLEHVLRFTYDESHTILGHSRARWVFEILRAAGFAHLIDECHAKDQNRNLAQLAAFNCQGQRHGLGISGPKGDLLTDPKALANSWGRMNCHHTLPGFTLQNSYAQHMGHQADWDEHQFWLRVLGLDVGKMFMILEHEQGNLRDQNFPRVLEAVALSAQYIRGVDAKADAQFRIGKWCPAVSDGKIQIYQSHDPLSFLPNIVQVVKKILAIPV